MGTHSKRNFGIGLALLAWPMSVIIGACGGASASSGASPPPATPHEKSEPATSDAPREDDAPTEEESPPHATCDDGTCSPCGAGMCPSGWYCDESVSGGPACSWLPQCAQKSSCACISGALGSACKCTQQGGGLHVTCK